MEKKKVYIKGYSNSNKNCELSNANQLKLSKDLMKRWNKAFAYIINNKKQYEEDAQKYSDDIRIYLLSLENNYSLFTTSILKIKERLNNYNLTLEDNKKIIVELLKLFHCNSVNANLSLYKMGDRIGRLSGNNITTGKIINKSITGIKESIYEF